jgi:hypothetical protein
LRIKDPLDNRFFKLRESGLSVDEAWKVIAIETLSDAGLVEPKPLERARVRTRPELGEIPVLEAKLVKVIRIEPADDDRIKALVAGGKRQSVASKEDDPSQSSIIRQALRLGLAELERRLVKK